MQVVDRLSFAGEPDLLAQPHGLGLVRGERMGELFYAIKGRGGRGIARVFASESLKPFISNELMRSSAPIAYRVELRRK
jgi:hypothetical protein